MANIELEHFNIDSLSRAELFRRIENHYQIMLPDHLLSQVKTLKDIAFYLNTISLTPAQTIPLKKKIILPSNASLNLSSIQTLSDIILLYGEKAPSKPHIYFQHEDGHEEIITYGHLLTMSLKAASIFLKKGLQEGETVAIMLPTTPDFFYTFLGVLLAGGIPVPIYPPFRAHLLESYTNMEAKILHNAEVRILVTFAQAEKLSHLLQAFVPSLKQVMTANIFEEGIKQVSLPLRQKTDGALIQYTSGSTSHPKGVLLSHDNLLANIRTFGKAVDINEEDIMVSWLPLYHDFGLIGAWLGSLYHGVPLVLMTPFSFLNHPERWLWTIHNYRGTLSGAPNFAYDLCIRKIEPARLEGLNLSSWRIAANGAEKIYPRTLKQFTEKFGPYGFHSQTLLPVYGLAESTVGLTITPLNRGFRIDEIDRKKFEIEQIAFPAQNNNTLAFVSCGLPILKHEVRIVNEDGYPLAERHVGRLEFRGPSSMQGYFNNPAATRAIYHDGWFDSGDLAYLADGEVFIAGRKKDLIIKAGRNIYPVEIEEMLGGITGIRQGCVVAFGANDIKRGTEQLIIVAETHENKAQQAIIKEKAYEALAALDIIPDQFILVSPPHYS